jgi:hypothetical protein
VCANFSTDCRMTMPFALINSRSDFVAAK